MQVTGPHNNSSSTQLVGISEFIRNFGPIFIFWVAVVTNFAHGAEDQDGVVLDAPARGKDVQAGDVGMADLKKIKQ